MSKTNIKLLTHGNILKTLILFALPFLFSSILQAGYGLADMLIISYFASEADLAGVTNGAQIAWTLIFLASGLTMGGTILIGQFFGARDLKNVQETISTMFVLFFWVSICLIVPVLFFIDPIMHILKIPTEAFQQGKDYVLVSTIGILFTFGYNGICAILRGLGDSKNPLYFILIASIINVILDIIFIKYLHMGAFGAGLATILAQGISFLIAIFYLKKKKFAFELSFSHKKFKKDKALLLFKVGVPLSLQDTFLMLSFLIGMISLNKLGLIVSAASGIAEKIDGLTFLPALAIGSAISAMVAQNVGARRIKRAKQVMFTGFLLSLVFAIPSFILVHFFPQWVMNLSSNNPAIIQAGADYLFSYSSSVLMITIVFSLNAFLNGCGATTFTMVNNSFANLCVRIPLLLLATDVMAVGFTSPLTIYSQITFALLYFYSGYWKKAIIKQNLKTKKSLKNT